MEYQSPRSLDVDSRDVIDSSRLHQHTLKTTEYVHYRGSSMYPTFHDPEFLLIEKPEEKTLRIGDVIVFKASHIDTMVIHRIIKVDNGLFITKGDNNSFVDPKPVDFKDIYGRATGILTKSGIRPVLNGTSGRILSRLHRLRKWLKHSVIKPLIWNSFTARSKNAMTRFVFITPKICKFESPLPQQQIRFVWNNRTIGFYNAITGRVAMKRLYRILINRPALEKMISDFLQSHPEIRNKKRDEAPEFLNEN
jgi:signal peptidase I